MQYCARNGVLQLLIQAKGRRAGEAGVANMNRLEVRSTGRGRLVDSRVPGWRLVDRRVWVILVKRRVARWRPRAMLLTEAAATEVGRCLASVRRCRQAAWRPGS